MTTGGVLDGHDGCQPLASSATTIAEADLRMIANGRGQSQWGRGKANGVGSLFCSNARKLNQSSLAINILRSPNKEKTPDPFIPNRPLYSEFSCDQADYLKRQLTGSPVSPPRTHCVRPSQRAGGPVSNVFGRFDVLWHVVQIRVIE